MTLKADKLLTGIRDDEIKRLIQGQHGDPHRILGAHPAFVNDDEGVIVRAFHPDAIKAEVLFEDESLPMIAAQGGLFCLFIKGATLPLRYRVRFEFPDGAEWESDAPYRFLPTFGEQDLYYAGQGKHYQLYEKLGAHIREIDGVRGVSFAVWAPNAGRVSLVGDFNNWDGRIFPMRSLGSAGIWEIFVPGLEKGVKYKYEIKTQQGDLRMKSDPFGFMMELRPGTASCVWDLGDYEWGDDEWIEARSKRNVFDSPMNIYEVHLGSWLRIEENGESRWATYREIAPRLVEHVREYGFTHVELLPVMEHPFDASWGYQVTGYFAPTSRFGTPSDFMYFVDLLHQNGIGVFLDWVPAHFPKDDYGLRYFDGTALYEHEDPRLAEHKDWGTLIFNYGRNEVRNFLVSNALFWLDKYHIDGLRVDAVASMLYLDYSRSEGEWVPNEYGGRENLGAIEFIKEFNTVLYKRFPGCVTIAEESTDWPGVTTPVYLGGLGFAFKWNMGWMHDTLEYFSKDPIHRTYHHNDLTFSMMYYQSENFILPLSHDEVVHGKGSLLRKMPGDDWQKFANLRLLLSYLYTHPGKKLLIAGSELGTWDEWWHEGDLERRLLEYEPHAGISRLVQDLGRLYQSEEALWKWDHKPEGFSWVDCNDHLHSVLSFVRRGPEGFLVVVLNFTPVVRRGYRVGMPEPGEYAEVFNSDSAYYWGSNVGSGDPLPTEAFPHHGHAQSIPLTLPPLGCLVLKKL